jgi:ribonuclease HII
LYHPHFRSVKANPLRATRALGYAGDMLVCGVDEAGRGPIAGPVTAAAVILPADFPKEALADSKALSPRRRERAEALIRERALAWATGWATPEEIDRLNIHQATLLAMGRALERLKIRPDLVLVDGLFAPATPLPCRTIVRGDASEAPIMAASILAKTARDRWMRIYGRRRPEYEFERHKGYPTRRHRRLVLEHGLSPIHRRSFRISPPG